MNILTSTLDISNINALVSFLYFLLRLLRQLRYKPLPSFKCVYTHDLYIHEWVCVCETEIDLCDNRPCSTYICLHIQRIKKNERERSLLVKGLSTTINDVIISLTRHLHFVLFYMRPNQIDGLVEMKEKRHDVFRLSRETDNR